MLKQVDVDAILKEMASTKKQVALEVLQDQEVPLILNEEGTVFLEELIEELEETEGIIFNI